MACEVRFIGQSKAVTAQVIISDSTEINKENNDKVFEEAARLYTKALNKAITFTQYKGN